MRLGGDKKVTFGALSPFTSHGHKGLYEILTMSRHGQLSLNLDMLGSLTIIVAHRMYAISPYPTMVHNFHCSHIIYGLVGFL